MAGYSHKPMARSANVKLRDCRVVAAVLLERRIMLHAQAEPPSLETQVRQDDIEEHEQKPLRARHLNSLCHFRWLR